MHVSLKVAVLVVATLIASCADGLVDDIDGVDDQGYVDSSDHELHEECGICDQDCDGYEADNDLCQGDDCNDYDPEMYPGHGCPIGGCMTKICTTP